MATLCNTCGYNPCGCTTAGSNCLSCSCNPCECGKFTTTNSRVNANPHHCTVCVGDTSNNIWFVPGPPGFPGKCKLDQLTFGQVMRILQRVPGARKDLLKITDDPTLIKLANTVKVIVPPQEDSARAAKRINANTLPYYTVFRGNMNGGYKP